MKGIDPKDLLNRYHHNQCSDEEKALVEAYYLNYNFIDIDLSEDELNSASQRIIERGGKTLQAKKQSILSLSTRIAAIAASLIIVFGIWTLFFATNNKLPAGYANDVKPGGNKATLTLANGTKINLSDAKNGAVANQSGLKIIKAADGSLIYEITGSKTDPEDIGYNTISTPKGGQYQITLSDGSMVWLNAESSLTYSAALKERGAQRRVKLIGEAYFEITKDPKHPFIVVTDKQEAKVLGTHFNIRAYPDEETARTTLLEGSLKVSAWQDEKTQQPASVILKPNQQSLSTGPDILVKEVDTDESVAWKNGEFSFANQSLGSIMKNIARWYDVDVVYESEGLKDKTFGGATSKYKNISDVLCILQLTGEVHFKIKGNLVTVMK